MERIMLERGDMTTLHEPFIYLYYLHDRKKQLDYFDPDPTQPTSYLDIREMILIAAKQRTVFVKDMCYYVADYILDDDEFLNRVTNTFLIRDPSRSVASYYKLDPGLTSEEVGLELQHRQFVHTMKASGRAPIVVDAADLLADTEGIVRAYCKRLGIPFLPHAMTWSGELPDEWQHVAGWQTDMTASKGIRKTADGEFRLDDYPALLDMVHHHKPFYEAMREYRIKGLRQFLTVILASARPSYRLQAMTCGRTSSVATA
jgi:hypothetical protein